MRYEDGWPEPNPKGSDVYAAWALVCAVFLTIFLIVLA